MDRFVTRTKKTKKVEEPEASTSKDWPQIESDKGASGECTDEEPVMKKRKVYDVKYRENWETEFKWLTKKSGKSYCINCDKSIAGGRKHLQRHTESDLHATNTRKIHGAVKIDEAVANIPTQILDKQIKNTELRLVMFATEHNLPFLIFEHLPQFICSLPDREVLKLVKCSRTKATGLVNNKMGPFAQTRLANILKNTFFSIIIDETTDISTRKCLVIVVRYYSRIEEKVVDSFFGLIELELSTADAIFNAVLSSFRNFEIPITNIIGFSSDNASVMMGNLNGVKAKLQNILPNIFVMGCVSHSLHLCASKACDKLPSNIEEMARNIFNYFSHSAKRKHDFKAFQQFVDTEPHTLLRPAQTRWLSLEAVINRILEQWNALTLYFQHESLIENVYGATEILNNLNNVVFKLYFHFLKHILNITCKMNLEFQSEHPRIDTLLPTLTMYYKTILKFYMQPNVVNSLKISRINPKNNDYFKKIEEIYLGASFENLFLEKSHELSASEIHTLRINCLNFYIQLCIEIRTRIDFEDEILNNISHVLEMNNIFNDEKPSIATLARKFPNIVNPESLEDLNLEWRQICNYKPSQSISNIEELIQCLNKQKDALNNPIFPNLLKFLSTIISLPHGSACAERIFSKLAIIKNKYRNSLNVNTVENLLFCKELIKSNNCYNWQPDDNLLQFSKNK